MKSIKQLIKKILLVDEGPKPLIFREQLKPIDSYDKDGFKYCKFGNLNPDKTFYIIKRSSHAGIFSYLSFVLNHLVISKENNFVPIVDMENYVNPYNEIESIDNTFNSWQYYFKQVSNYNLNEVYKSKNVVFSRDDFHHKMSYRIHLDKNFEKFKNKEISIKDKYKVFLDNFMNDHNLNNKKILGIHFRGTSYKTSRGHILPATENQIQKYIDEILIKESHDKIFLCTEETRYLNFLKKRYSNKLLYLNTYRSNKNDAFLNYERKNHRYLLGDEAIKDTLILSKCSSLLFVRSNIINAANYFSEKEQSMYEVFNGFNSRNQFIARWLWYIKKNLPKRFYGLNDELIISKN